MSEETNLNTESMENYKEAIDSSVKPVNEGDILTGTVISVSDTEVIVDLNYYAEGIITVDNLSNDPNFQINEDIKTGDQISATVIKTDDGNGRIVLSKKEANDTLAWDKLEELRSNGTPITVKISSVTKGGVIVYAEGVRGFIPASKLDVGYVENLDEWLNKEVQVKVVTCSKDENKLVLSAKEIALEAVAKENNKKIAELTAGMSVTGIVESIKEYGAFVQLENGVTGLLHVSQISDKRIKTPDVVLKIGDEITAKIIKIDGSKISLSMKALQNVSVPEVKEDYFKYKSGGESATTGLGSILSKIKL